ncbi:MAG: NAD-dependent epimerase/dehydratase family protein [Patescibacteria group bacterium]
MKYIITGGAGFIGSTLAKRFVNEGHEVIVIDNLSTGKRERIPEGATLIEWDLTNEDIETLAAHIKGADGVFHFAALPRVPFSIEHPILSSKHNIFGTLHALVAARDAGVKRFVYSASSSAYGNQETLPLHPDMKPNPLSPYALQKLVGEYYCSLFASLYGIETVSLRYFNVYGPGMAEEGAYAPVFAIFKRQVLSGEPLRVYGDGSQSRSFCHVDDVVEANIKAMTSAKVGKGEILNVSGFDRVTVRNIAERFNHPISYVEPRPGDVQHTLGDISRTKELIDWEPRIDFDDGFEQLMKHWGMKGH